MAIWPQFKMRMAELLGSDAECRDFFAALEKLAKEPRPSVRLNPLRVVTAAELIKLGLALDQPVPWAQESYWLAPDPQKSWRLHPLWGAALAYMQEAGAMEAVSLLNPQPGDWVLDMCAAPGSKSTQIAESLRGQGWLLTNEVNRARAETLSLLLARHGALNVSVLSLPSRDLAQRFPATFDRVLVDAPCSGESLFAKRFDARADISEREVDACAKRQRGILMDAAQCVAAGGKVVYSTCTYARAENEAVVQAFLEVHPAWQLLQESRRFPHKDFVPGGYCAVLQAPGDQLPRSERPAAQWHHPKAFGEIRHGPHRWDGGLDDYAFCMQAAVAGDWRAQVPDESMRLSPKAGAEEQRVPSGFSPGPLPRLEVSFQAAQTYLRGEAIVLDSELRGPVCITWQGYALGMAKAVPGRVNNLLPKGLRTR